MVYWLPAPPKKPISGWKWFFFQYSNGPKIRLWYIDPDNNKKMSTSLDKQQIFGELTYVLQPLIHLSSLGIFGIKSWTPWLLSVICDILRWIFYKKWRPLISREKFQYLYKHGCGVFSYFHNSIIKKKLLTEAGAYPQLPTQPNFFWSFSNLYSNLL